MIGTRFGKSVYTLLGFLILSVSSIGVLYSQAIISSDGKAANEKFIVFYKDKISSSSRFGSPILPKERAQLMRNKVTATLQKNRVSIQKVHHIYDNLTNGFAVEGLTNEELKQLRNDPSISRVIPDQIVSLPEPIVNSTAVGDSLTDCDVVASVKFDAPYLNYDYLDNTPSGGMSIARFGAFTAISAPAVMTNASPTQNLGCDLSIFNDLTGKIALIDRGTCVFSEKAYNAQLKGAVGVVIINNVSSRPEIMNGGEFADLVTIPVIQIPQNIGTTLKNVLSYGFPLTITINFGTPYTAQCTPWGVQRVRGGVSGIGKRAWIVDTGIDLDHPDLNVDTTLSRHFVGNSADDVYGHGTHVAGIVAAKDNNFGVVGVAAGATVVAVKVLGDDGKGDLSEIIAGLEYIALHAQASDVVNMSIGGYNFIPEYEEVIVNLSAICKVVLSAGNDAVNTNYQVPARINSPNVFTVSSFGKTDHRSSFSNYGSSVAFAAPGEDILSCMPRGTYEKLTGTSMSAPHVAGMILIGGMMPTGRVKEDVDGNADLIPTLGCQGMESDEDGDGFSICQGDLDDTNANVYPGASEICDGVDNDGDGEVDEGDVCCPEGTTTILYVKQSATGANTGLSWDNAFTTLQQALTTARKCSRFTQIWVAKGTYVPTTNDFGLDKGVYEWQKTFLLQSSVAIYGGFEGSEQESFDLDQRDFILNETILSGDVLNTNNRNSYASNVVRIIPDYGKSIDSTTVLDGFTITKGAGIGNRLNYPELMGGGLNVIGSSPTISNIVFHTNYSYVGGALTNYYSQASYSHLKMYNNTAEFLGGAIYNQLSNIEMANSTFQLNTANSKFTSYPGGTIFDENSKSTYTNIVVTGNKAIGSGGILADKRSATAISNSIIWNNLPLSNTMTVDTSEVKVSMGLDSSSVVIVRNSICTDCIGATNRDIDPMFFTNTNYNNKTLGDLRLVPCSPGVNKGSNSSFLSIGTTDLAGNARVYGDTIDIGAYEYQSGAVMVGIVAIPNTSLVQGETASLTASGADTYVWSTSETSSTIQVSPEVTSSYTVTGRIGGDSNGCLGTASIDVVIGGSLPVQLLSFSVRSQMNNTVVLDWITAEEVNHAYFEIERSADLQNIEIVSRLNYNSLSQVFNTYRYVDETPLKGHSYYRLKQVDIDGTVTYFDWKSIMLDQEHMVYPNPILAGEFTVQLQDSEQAVLTLITTEGRNVPLTITSKKSDRTALQLPNGLTPGIYYLRVEERGTLRIHKVIVK